MDDSLKLSSRQRQYRRFSDEFKRKKVRELELGMVRIAELCRQYQVTSSAVYKWLSVFGTSKYKPDRLIMESKSDTQELLRLKQRIAELERLVGQKQIQLEFTEKMIEVAEQMYGVDIKKKFSTPPSATSGNTEVS